VKKKDFDILFAISNVWSFAFIAMAILATLKVRGLEMNHYYAVVYLTALGTYVGGRKTYNKLTKNQSKRRGEWFVAIWAAVWLAAVVAKYFSREIFVVPEAVSEIAIGVVAIFGIGKISEKILPKNGKEEEKKTNESS